jgi:hypothetical protein
MWGWRNRLICHGVAAAPVSCFYIAAGIYSTFALKLVAPIGGRKPTFLLLAVTAHAGPV